MRDKRFFAAMQGVNLDEATGTDAKDKVEEMKRRIEARNAGLSDDQFEFNELDLDFEIEE